MSSKTFTRSQKSSALSETFKSAVAEHVARTNPVIDWDNIRIRIVDQESNKMTRWLKESIWISSRGINAMNKDEGSYILNRIYDQLINKSQPSKLMTSST